MNEVQRVLTDASAILRTDGWTQGSFGRRTGPHCLFGAVDIATGDDSGLYVLVAGVVSDVIGTENRLDWNDAPGRTIDEVLWAIEAAYDAAEDDE